MEQAKKKEEKPRYSEEELREMMRNSCDDYKIVSNVKFTIPADKMEALKIDVGELAAKIKALESEKAAAVAPFNAQIKMLKTELGPKAAAITDGQYDLQSEEVYLYIDQSGPQAKWMTEIKHYTGETIMIRRATIEEKQLLFNHKITPIDGRQAEH